MRGLGGGGCVLVVLVVIEGPALGLRIVLGPE